MHKYIHTYIYIHSYIFMYGYIPIHIHIHIHTYHMYICIYTISTYISYLYIYTYILCTLVSKYLCSADVALLWHHVNTRFRLATAHTHTHPHKDTHMHTRTCIQLRELGGRVTRRTRLLTLSTRLFELISLSGNGAQLHVTHFRLFARLGCVCVRVCACEKERVCNCL